MVVDEMCTPRHERKILGLIYDVFGDDTDVLNEADWESEETLRKAVAAVARRAAANVPAVDAPVVGKPLTKKQRVAAMNGSIGGLL